ncbi:MAG: DUF1614 domain-containing protein [Candidatus Thermoplasmatota archaeon]|nr:DUF1614 domain-containing protein [Candidatus Thermoplasmatota archaeon]
MAQELELTLVFIVVGLSLLLIYLYITTIEKVLEKVGFTKGEASSILFLTLFFGWITIPMFPYPGTEWWVGISLGGGIIPIVICSILLKSKRVSLAEGFIGLVIVATVTYFVTRPEEGVGIVAEVPWAFMPAIAAGLYSVSAFWLDIRRAAPLAYFSGVTGTLVGADVFHLQEILSYPPPAESTFPLLSIGGANIFDMVYISGIVAVLVGVLIFWYDRQRRKLGFERFIADWRAGAEGLPYAKEPTPSKTLRPDRRGRL